MGKEKLAITCWNYKGGTGKTTVALILAQIAAQKGLHVLVMYLDDQHNLQDTLALSERLFPSIEVMTDIPQGAAELDFDMFIMDTHPDMNDKIKSALAFSDIVLIPILGDFLSVSNLGAAWNYIQEAGLGFQQAALVKNCMENIKTTREIEVILQEQGYPVAGRLPRNNNILRNIASGNNWNAHMDERQQAPFISLYSKLWEAYRRMLKGNFKTPWN